MIGQHAADHLVESGDRLIIADVMLQAGDASVIVGEFVPTDSSHLPL